MAAAKCSFLCHVSVKKFPAWRSDCCFAEEHERENSLLKQLHASDQSHQKDLLEGRYFDKWNTVLDTATSGPHWLEQPEIADVVKEAMHYRDGKVFDLHAFCIMSNHVHVVFAPLSKSEWYSDLLTSEYHSDLPKIMQSLKRHTARQSNLILGREGAFWQDESYDRVIRDGEEYIRIISYVLENPVKAGLVLT